MGMYKYLDEIMGNKLSGIHTAYLAKVLSIDEYNKTAKIQPLGLINNADGTTSSQSVLTKVPFARHVSLRKGYVVVCICCENNISDAKRGVNAATPGGKTFSMSDSVIIAALY